MDSQLLKKTIFTILAALLPVAFLVLLEIGLRIAGLFPQEPLFLDDIQQDRDAVVVNEAIGKRYFDQQGIPIPNLYPHTFSKQKSARGIRIFCLGGSTTEGFPYEMTVPFPKQMELRLTDRFPDYEFEVINLGLSAINSFTVWDWIPEIVEQAPDLVIIYMGHNEFYGAYGTASTISLGGNGRLTRLLLRLKRLRIVQMLEHLKPSSPVESSDSTDATLMEKVIADRFIAADSELRQRTIQNFEENLNLILTALDDQDIPVVLSTLVSNLKDQPPLEVTGSKRAQEGQALDYFNTASQLLIEGDSSTAVDFFWQAVDADGIPFRAGRQLNASIMHLAHDFKVPVVDMSAVFDRAGYGIPGDDILCDHLHPNPLGYALMGHIFANEAARTLGLPDRPIQDDMAPQLVTPLDWEIGGLRIFKLEQRWPFGNRAVDYDTYIPLKDSSTTRIAKQFLFEHSVWGKAHEDMARHLVEQGDLRAAIAEYQAIIEMYPDRSSSYFELIKCAGVLQDWAVLVATCEAGIKTFSDPTPFLYESAFALQRLRQSSAALESIESAMQSPRLNDQQITRGRMLKAQLLVEIGRKTDAQIVLRNLLTLKPDFYPAQVMLQDISTP